VSTLITSLLSQQLGTDADLVKVKELETLSHRARLRAGVGNGIGAAAIDAPHLRAPPAALARAGAGAGPGRLTRAFARSVPHPDQVCII
jgi:hypothetical protein